LDLFTGAHLSPALGEHSEHTQLLRRKLDQNAAAAELEPAHVEFEDAESEHRDFRGGGSHGSSIRGSRSINRIRNDLKPLMCPRKLKHSQGLVANPKLTASVLQPTGGTGTIAA
jgi:hypothetical protein